MVSDFSSCSKLKRLVMEVYTPPFAVACARLIPQVVDHPTGSASEHEGCTRWEVLGALVQDFVEVGAT
jgi:hypothetical protein